MYILVVCIVCHVLHGWLESISTALVVAALGLSVERGVVCGSVTMMDGEHALLMFVAPNRVSESE